MAGKKVDTVVRYSPLDIQKIVKAHYQAEPKVPVNFTAEPSTVKSEGVFRVAKELAEEEQREFLEWNRIPLEQKNRVVADPAKWFIFADLRASETDIGELRLQDIKNGEEFITFKYNILFAALSKPEAKGILFFDEMNLAPNMIKAQFYKIINDRAVGDIPISEGVLCISAGNESEHARGVTEDPVPLVLRRGNYFLRPLTAEEYTDFAVAAGQHQWIVGYLGFQPGDVHKIDYELPDAVGQPCPRTWTKLSSILKANPTMSVSEVEMMSTGMVGQGVAKKFAAYVKSAKAIDLKDIIAHPEKVRQLEATDEVSLLYAVISGVVDMFRDDKKIIIPAAQIALELKRSEFGAYLLRSLKNVDEKKFRSAWVDDKLMKKELVDKVVDRFAKYVLRAA